MTAVHHASMYAKGGGGASGGAPVGKSTGATAGTPGAFTPANSRIPASSGDMTGVTASPATNWTVGQYVQTRTDRAYWNGTAWVAGAHP